MKTLLSLAIATLFSGCAAPERSQPSSTPPSPSTAATSPEVGVLRFRHPTDAILDGTWSGTLQMRMPLSPTRRGEPPDESDVELKVVIGGEKVQVYLKDGNEFVEAMPGGFVLLRTFTNAAIVGLATGDGGSKGSDGWIENWSILLTAKDDETVLVEWTRVVNNLRPGPRAFPAFSMRASGSLSRAR